MREETGLVCELDDELPQTRYVDSRGRPKRVRWWRMRPIGDSVLERSDEVDDLRWLEPVDAAALLSYERDLVLLANL